MKKISLVVIGLMIVFCVGNVIAQEDDNPIVQISKNTGGGFPFAYESITVDSTEGGKTLTANTYTTKCKKAFITVETAELRFRIDGTGPTSSEGHLLEPGESITLHNYAQIVKFKAIRTGSTSAVLKITYLK